LKPVQLHVAPVDAGNFERWAAPTKASLSDVQRTMNSAAGRPTVEDKTIRKIVAARLKDFRHSEGDKLLSKISLFGPEKHSNVVSCTLIDQMRFRYTTISNDVAALLKQRSDQVRWRAVHAMCFNEDYTRLNDQPAQNIV
jgi:hypothetical protein